MGWCKTWTLDSGICTTVFSCLKACHFVNIYEEQHADLTWGMALVIMLVLCILKDSVEVGADNPFFLATVSEILYPWVSIPTIRSFSLIKSLLYITPNYVV